MNLLRIRLRVYHLHNKEHLLLYKTCTHTTAWTVKEYGISQGHFGCKQGKTRNQVNNKQELCVKEFELTGLKLKNHKEEIWWKFGERSWSGSLVI